MRECGQAKKQAMIGGLTKKEVSECDLSREGEEQNQVKVEGRGWQG